MFWFKLGFYPYLFFFGIRLVFFILFLWFRDVNREGSHQGCHNLLVQSRLKWGLVWFLFREVWFFFRVFWTFFHVRVCPITRLFWEWPPTGIERISFFQIPLLNTLILLRSGLTATLSHQELLNGNKSIWVIVRMILGIYFLFLQGAEYYVSSFLIITRIYGRVFFFGTGFHGLHVLLGTIMLTIRRVRLQYCIITSNHHFGLEFSLWYWHFVDVVWLFLFFWVYTWGN